MRILLALLVLTVAGKIALDLLLKPAELYQPEPGAAAMIRALLLCLAMVLPAAAQDAPAETVVAGLSQNRGLDHRPVSTGPRS